MVDAPEHVGKPSLRIDIVELGRVNERQHHSGALPTAIGSSEQPRLPPESNSTQLAFSSIVAQTDATVIEEARERIDGLSM